MLIYLMAIESQSERDKVEQIYIQYKQLMYYVAYSVLQDRQFAEDAVHESFLKIIVCLDKFSDISCNKSKGLIVIITRNTSLDILRKSKKIAQIALDDVAYTLESNESSPADFVTAADGYKLLLQCISHLDHKYTDALYLKYVYNYDDKEIAKILHITDDHVRVRLHRAKKSCGKYWGRRGCTMNKEQQQEKLFDAMLAIALEEDFEKRMEQLPSEEELAKIHPVSLELTARMEKTIKNYRHKTRIRQMTRFGGKIAAVVAILLVGSFGVLMSVEASRVQVLNTIMEYQKEFIRFSFKEENTDFQKSPYRLGYIPDGFKEKETRKAGAGFTTKYLNSQGNEIIFDQTPLKESGSMAVDNENTNFMKIDIGGYPAYLFEGKTKADRTIIIWRNSVYHFELISYLDKNELLKIAESVAVNK
ncbi:sigma-70 family RNA polymerase sigma factor [Candidatus Formimonas warabiya]|uniref:Sigma-70 family RNA polymerase sigma factor n=1 Tax=Formimonas warabiya TaxID=1761012 RepID=A0A3G1KV51_FORW1|nr:sigma-70 family RNA polymerase sigma factor [Candidatus Formimonas warabiya]ATW26329.1 hypothetical protein DCMF_17560 [Candidatus Formimonas warabiya]